MAASRSRRQVRRLSLSTPWVRQPPVHNEIAMEKRRAKMWRRWRRILRSRPTPWQTPDLSEYLAILDEQIRLLTDETQTPRSMVSMRGFAGPTLMILDETHRHDPPVAFDKTVVRPDSSAVVWMDVASA